MAPPITDGLVLDLDPALGITMDGSNRVSQWEDQSGQGNHFVQATGVNQPLWTETLPYHEMPCVEFDGALGARYMDCVKGDMFRNVPGITVVIVLRTAGSGWQHYFDVSKGNSIAYNNQRFWLGAQVGNDSSYGLGGARLDGDATFLYNPQPTGFNANYGVIISGRIDYLSPQITLGQSRFLGYSTTNSYLSGSGNTSDTDSLLIRLGANFDQTNRTYGKIIRVIAYDRYLGNSEMTELYNYFDSDYFSVNKTYGIGADFSNLGAALGWLAARSGEWSIQSDVAINGISDTVQNSAAAYTIKIYKAAEIDIVIDGGNFLIEQDSCGFKIVGSPDYWRTDQYYGSFQTVNYNWQSRIVLRNAKINAIGSSGGAAIELRPLGYGTSIYNVLIFSTDSENMRLGIVTGRWRGQDWYLNIFSGIICGLSCGVSASQESASIQSEGGGYENQIIENCTLLNCGFGTPGDYAGYAIIAYHPASVNLVFRNIAILRNDEIISQDINWRNSINTIVFQNCATSDATTFSDRAVADPDQITDCRDNIDPAAQLLSTDISNSNFLKPMVMEQTGLWNGGIAPEFAINDYVGVAYALGGYYPIGALKSGIFEDDSEVPGETVPENGGGFTYNPETGLFTAQASSSILGTVFLLLRMKARSNQQKNGIPVYPGDWFFDAEKGQRLYEIKTTTTDVLRRVENAVSIALLPVKNENVQRYDVRAEFDARVRGRINTLITFIMRDGSSFTYTHFYEVA